MYLFLYQQIVKYDTITQFLIYDQLFSKKAIILKLLSFFL